MTGLEPAVYAAIFTASAATVSAVGAIRQGQAAAASANYNAAVARMNEDAANSQSIAASEALQRDQQRRIGAATAAYGASGVQLSDGDPADVLAESARAASLDLATLKYNYRLKGLGYQAQANLDESNAKNSRTAGVLGAMSAVTNAGASYYQRFG